MGSIKLHTELHGLLKECYRRPHRFCLSQRRHNSANSVANGDVYQHIAVLGGGITGLTATYLLSQKLPSANITLYDNRDTLGGWLQSSEVEVGNGRVIFEHGPRTLRPQGASGMATLDLIRRLGIANEVLTTSRESAAAQNRFIYYPDHLVRMPGPGQSFWDIFNTVTSEEVFRNVPSGMLLEFFKEPRRSGLEDESVGSFFRRRFNSAFVDKILSAVLHGIYAGDVDRLSIRSLFPQLWFLEKAHGSLVRSTMASLLSKSIIVRRQDLQFLQSINSDWHDEDGKLLKGLEAVHEITNSSVYTFKAGLGTLSSVLEDELKAAKNVKIVRKTNAVPQNIEHKDGTSKVVLQLNPDEVPTPDLAYHDYVIATSNPGRFALDDAGRPFDKVTVMVVNLHYAASNILPARGFGYLIPRAIPFSQNPEMGLGVVFDSDATQCQDTVPGTKVTVMLGGHWWSDWDSFPDSKDGYNMARSILERHLGIRDVPDAWKATLQSNCITQYHVGHSKRLNIMSKKLKEKFQGRLSVAGSEFHGISVNDCIRSAYIAATNIEKGKRDTGLDDLKLDFLAPARAQI